MGWSLDSGADKYVKGMTEATRRAEKVMLESVARSLLELDKDLRNM